MIGIILGAQAFVLAIQAWLTVKTYLVLRTWRDTPMEFEVEYEDEADDDEEPTDPGSNAASWIH